MCPQPLPPFLASRYLDSGSVAPVTECVRVAGGERVPSGVFVFRVEGEGEQKEERKREE